MIKKIIVAWYEYYTIKSVKNQRNKEAQRLYSANIFRNCLKTWTANFRHQRWENKVNGKAELLLHTKLLKNAFRNWFDKKTDWKEIYFYQKVKPKIFYEMHLKSKTVYAWKKFLQMANVQKERLRDARNARRNLILSESLRAWILVYDPYLD